jgi:sugar phosphate isomerase/epimerase
MTAAPQESPAATALPRQLRLAALTSYSTERLSDKILNLARAGIHLLDLYCFCEGDLQQLFPGPAGRHPFDNFLKYFEPGVAANTIWNFCREAEQATQKEIQIIGIASFVPDIASPDSGRRQASVDFLIRLLHFVRALRDQEFWCETVELVTGHTITLTDPSDEPPPRTRERRTLRGFPRRKWIDFLKRVKGSKTTPPIFMKAVPPAEALGFLLESLRKLVEARDAILWPEESGAPFLACELEPSLGRLVHDDASLQNLLRGTQNQNDFPRVGFNLDIGHMEIARVGRGILAGNHADKLVHVHISNNASEHYADLAIDAKAGYEPAVFQDWLADAHKCWQAGSGLYRGGLSIEIEACGDVKVVRQAYETIAQWLRDMNIPYV